MMLSFCRTLFETGHVERQDTLHETWRIFSNETISSYRFMWGAGGSCMKYIELPNIGRRAKFEHQLYVILKRDLVPNPTVYQWSLL